MRRRLRGDYAEVNAPQILDKALWETSGHWGWYRENMFAAQSAGEEAEDKRWFALKPMNCPGHVQIFKHGLKSYRDLPLRMAEFGVVHRYEPSGAMHGLMRRARLHPGRRAHLLHRGPARRRVPEDQRPDPLDLCRFRLRRDRREALDPAGEARRLGRPVGPRRERDDAGAGADRGAVGRADQDRREPRRGRLLRAEVRVRPARRHRPRLAMRDDAGGLQPARAVRRVLRRCGRAEEAAGHGPPGDLRLDGAVHRHPDRAFRRAFPALARPVQVVVATITGEADAYAAKVVRALERAACGWRRT